MYFLFPPPVSLFLGSFFGLISFSFGTPTLVIFFVSFVDCSQLFPSFPLLPHSPGVFPEGRSPFLSSAVPFLIHSESNKALSSLAFLTKVPSYLSPQRESKARHKKVFFSLPIRPFLFQTSFHATRNSMNSSLSLFFFSFFFSHTNYSRKPFRSPSIP